MQPLASYAKTESYVNACFSYITRLYLQVSWLDDNDVLGFALMLYDPCVHYVIRIHICIYDKASPSLRNDNLSRSVAYVLVCVSNIL